MQLAPGVRKISAKLSKMATFLRLSDLTSVTCSPETPTHEVLRRLNESDYLFFIVIDCTGKPLGTITDGDVRRAMLDGATLNDPSSRCMFHQPTKKAILGHKSFASRSEHAITNHKFYTCLLHLKKKKI